ncbi:uncharacterized protein Z518_07415 [Rhinocladiella mackenziei CBS 650.93]|uniref:Rhinocladiella mackenziei CBS 650.93 unplaced genomic scaffold supercont1.5, whole genome shotgun sequence n=1 Tax=Rhinocladiella mackenziei CBS 650.93 TaxID=1442369 RepID=A0A0D2FP10_9EURO|nr:uncharacterized protein Z518_07415 [Rhinocladiella mackenziei CBS 650.93]KIX03862.1 hypothetical protein Z518_07415 [Rhinocladiella mackenziei CBS 650.93]
MAGDSNKTPKRLIVLCDGTWQNAVNVESYDYPTNVTRFSRALSQFGERDGKFVPQIIYYQPGVGTGVADKITGGVYGAGLSANVRAAYGFLAHNYNPGDQIYFFGYSRGAYTARAIAGLITSLGLLTKKGMDRFHSVYQEYYHPKDEPKAGNDRKPNVEKLQQLAGDELHEGAKDAIEIVGVWDTVGFHKAGWMGEEFEFYNTRLSDKVSHGFHALSLDETREAFLPTLWESNTNDAGGKNAKQVWFCGEHGIGGGSKDSDLADISLAWMIAECYKTKKLSFVDLDGDPATSYLLAGGTDAAALDTAEAEQETAQWKTALYPKAEESFMGIAALRKGATKLLWTLSNWVLPGKSGVRKPNENAFEPGETNERIHQSIRDRRLGRGEWPCTPIKGRMGGEESKLWELTRKTGAVLEETVPDVIELKLKGRIRPVT